jgi:hypothetical protein
MLHYRTAWSDYFPGTNPTKTLGPKEYSLTQTVSVTYVYVSNCLFNKCTSSSYGGALYCSTSVNYLLVESSSFFSCKTGSSYGGAIYFSITNSGECILHIVCCNDCFSTIASNSVGQSANIQLMQNNALNRNYVNYSSIVCCVSENLKSYHTLRLYYGKICCPSINISMNKCGYRSAVCCHPTSDSNSLTCSFSHSSFADNSASNCNCIFFVAEGAKYEMKCCNILRNTQINLNLDGIVILNGNLMVKDSCILENIATYTFYASSPYTATLSNCTVDKMTKTGSLIMQNTVTKSFIHALNHMSTLSCHAEYDAIGTLTPITESSSKRQRLYFSCEVIFYQLPPQTFLFFVSFYFSV